MATIAFIPITNNSNSEKLFCGVPLIRKMISTLNSCSDIDRIIIFGRNNLSTSGSAVTSHDKTQSFTIPDNSKAESWGDLFYKYLESYTLNDDDLIVFFPELNPFLDLQDLAILKSFQGDKPTVSCFRSTGIMRNENGTILNLKETGNQSLFIQTDSLFISNVGRLRKAGSISKSMEGGVTVLEIGREKMFNLNSDEEWESAETVFRNKYGSEEVKFNSKVKVKLFLTDVDGVLTDAGMYYSETGDELKKFNTHDGKGLELLRKSGIKTGIITSENTSIVTNRAKKLKVDYLYQGAEGQSKLSKALEICIMEGINISEVAYVGDDINCRELLSAVGIAACPKNALPAIKSIPGILQLTKSGGEGAVREFAEIILAKR